MRKIAVSMHSAALELLGWLLPCAMKDELDADPPQKAKYST